MKNLLASGFRIQNGLIGKMLHLLNKTTARIQLLLSHTVIDVSSIFSNSMAKNLMKSIFFAQFNPAVKDVYNYFRAIISSGEKSLRALHLTDDALKLNASNYTVWQYR